jgi:TfoX/Sxy family transcriptional regulator of competence genes
MAYDEQLADRLRDLVSGEPGVTEKKMFGGLAFLVGGHMAVGASSQGDLMVRVDPERTEELLAEPHAAPFVMRGREMSGWLRVDTAGLGSEAELRRWTDVGVAYARSLPPK